MRVNAYLCNSIRIFVSQAKWQEFASGRKVVRYDEADQIMFDIIKDEYNDFNTGTNVRIPTLKTLPAFIDKIKGESRPQGRTIRNWCFALCYFSRIENIFGDGRGRFIAHQ